jgi:hypothetical protein
MQPSNSSRRARRYVHSADSVNIQSSGPQIQSTLPLSAFSGEPVLTDSPDFDRSRSPLATEETPRNACNSDEQGGHQRARLCAAASWH